MSSVLQVGSVNDRKFENDYFGSYKCVSDLTIDLQISDIEDPIMSLLKNEVMLCHTVVY
jgi:hypothetical protein